MKTAKKRKRARLQRNTYGGTRSGKDFTIPSFVEGRSDYYIELLSEKFRQLPGISVLDVFKRRYRMDLDELYAELKSASYTYLLSKIRTGPYEIRETYDEHGPMERLRMYNAIKTGISRFIAVELSRIPYESNEQLQDALMDLLGKLRNIIREHTYERWIDQNFRDIISTGRILHYPLFSLSRDGVTNVTYDRDTPTMTYMVNESNRVVPIPDSLRAPVPSAPPMEIEEEPVATTAVIVPKIPMAEARIEPTPSAPIEKAPIDPIPSAPFEEALNDRSMRPPLIRRETSIVEPVTSRRYDVAPSQPSTSNIFLPEAPDHLPTVRTVTRPNTLNPIPLGGGKKKKKTKRRRNRKRQKSNRRKNAKSTA
jgi:hypothetical protein